MQSVMRMCLAAALVAGLPAVASAEPDAKALPTLLIKGEVVSLEASDPAAPILKVKDRYGFETPIFLGEATTIMQGDAALTSSDLTAGAPVEVEYNFDVNTAKRHAVSVKLAASAAPVPAAEAVQAEPVDPAAAEIPAGMGEPAAPADDAESEEPEAVPAAE